MKTYRNLLRETVLQVGSNGLGAIVLGGAQRGWCGFDADDDGLEFDITLVEGMRREVFEAVYTHAGRSLSRGKVLRSTDQNNRIAFTQRATAQVVISAETINQLLGNGGPVDPEPQPDTQAPTLAGAVTPTNVTSTGATLTCPAATDNVGVTGYRFSTNGGTSWLTSSTNSLAVSGLAPGSVYALRAQARDAAGNWSTSISGTLTTSAPSADSRPRLFYAPANATGDAAIFLAAWSAAIPLGGSSNGGRTGTFSTEAKSDTTLFPWVAVPTSAVGAGVRFFDGTTYGGYSGALNTNIRTNGDPADPITIYHTWVDPNGVSMALFRRNGKATAATSGNSIL